MVVRELNSFDRAAWDQRVVSLPEGTINQSTHVEGFHMVTGGGYRPRYLVAEGEDGEVLGQLVLLTGFFGAQEVVTHPLLRGMAPLCARTFGVSTWMQGPLVFARERFAEVHRALLGHVSLRGGGGVYQIRRVTLPFYADQKLADQAGEVLGGLGFSSQNEATFHVDLRQPQEALWQGLKSSARKNLRKLLEGGGLVSLPLDTPADVAAYWEMLVATQRRSGRFVSYRTLADFEAKFWGQPHREGVLRGLLVRTTEGEPVAGLCFRAFNGWIQELGVAYSEFGIQHKLYGQDLIKWALMCWGHEQGYARYDLMGVEVGSEDPKRRAIYQFKEKWGGELVEYRSFAKVYSPWRAAAISLGVRIGRRIRAGKRRPPVLTREER